MTDSSQSIQSQFSYDPWGVPTQIAGTGVTPDFGFAGYYLHSRSGLNLTLDRAYSTTVGRWLSRDPIGESNLLAYGSLGANSQATLYGYVSNNPISFVDPFGLQCQNPDYNFYPYSSYHFGPESFVLPPTMDMTPAERGAYWANTFQNDIREIYGGSEQTENMNQPVENSIKGYENSHVDNN